MEGCCVYTVEMMVVFSEEDHTFKFSEGCFNGCERFRTAYQIFDISVSCRRRAVPRAHSDESYRIRVSVLIILP